MRVRFSIITLLTLIATIDLSPCYAAPPRRIEWRGVIEIGTDGWSKFNWRRANGATHGYLIPSDAPHAESLWNMLSALSNAAPHSPPTSFSPRVWLFSGDRLAAEFFLTIEDAEKRPFWQGVQLECEEIAQSDMAYAVAYRDNAELLANDGQVEKAGYTYERALRLLVAWRYKWSRQSPFDYVDDSEVAIMFLERASPSEYLSRLREIWDRLTHGCIRLRRTASETRILFSVPDSECIRSAVDSAAMSLLNGDADGASRQCAATFETLSEYSTQFPQIAELSFSAAICASNVAVLSAAQGAAAPTSTSTVDVFRHIQFVSDDDVDSAWMAWSLSMLPGLSESDRMAGVAFAQRAVDLAPESCGAWRVLGVSQFAADDPIGAIDAFSEAERRRDDMEEFGFIWAAAHQQTGDEDAAARRAEKTRASLDCCQYEPDMWIRSRWFERYWRCVQNDFESNLDFILLPRLN